MLVLNAKDDSVTLGFTVTVFLTGEWQVRNIQNIKDYEGRESKLGT